MAPLADAAVCPRSRAWLRELAEVRRDTPSHCQADIAGRHVRGRRLAVVNGDAERSGNCCVSIRTWRGPFDARARATLLHYVSANGVEGYRQLSPRNSGEIAEI